MDLKDFRGTLPLKKKIEKIRPPKGTFVFFNSYQTVTLHGNVPSEYFSNSRCFSICSNRTNHIFVPHKCNVSPKFLLIALNFSNYMDSHSTYGLVRRY